MVNTEYEKIIREAISSCSNESGWANLADLGAVLRENGIKYKKLSKFLSEYHHMVEIRIDESKQPPVVYTKLKEAQMA